MAIVVGCPKCGRQLNVASEFAGRQGKCPACGGTIDVPATGASDGALRSAHTGAAPHGAVSQGGAHARSTHSCPSCGTHVSADAALCVSCGTDLRTGRKLAVAQQDSANDRGEEVVREPSILVALGGLALVMFCFAMALTGAGYLLPSDVVHSGAFKTTCVLLAIVVPVLCLRAVIGIIGSRCPQCGKRVVCARYAEGSYRRSGGGGSPTNVGWGHQSICLHCQPQRCMIEGCNRRATRRNSHRWWVGPRPGVLLVNDLWFCRRHARALVFPRWVRTIFVPIFWPAAVAAVIAGIAYFFAIDKTVFRPALICSGIIAGASLIILIIGDTWRSKLSLEKKSQYVSMISVSHPSGVKHNIDRGFGA